MLGGRDTYVLGVTAVAAGPGVYVLYAAEVKQNWDVYAVLCGPDGPGQPLAIGSDPAVDVNPAAAWHQGTLHVAWESNRQGRRQVWATAVRDGPGGAAGGASARPTARRTIRRWRCSRAAKPAWPGTASGTTTTTSTCGAPRAGGDWAPAVRLTKAPGVDRHAVLLARGDELWLAYEHAQVEKYFVGRTNSRRVLVARVDGDELQGLPDLNRSPLGDRSEAARWPSTAAAGCGWRS